MSKSKSSVSQLAYHLFLILVNHSFAQRKYCCRPSFIIIIDHHHIIIIIMAIPYRIAIELVAVTDR